MQVENLLEASAARFPDKTAVICGKDRLSYREVEQKCNRLAHSLLRAGVRRGDRVAVWMENSVEAVLSVLATLKAGAAFMMISPGARPDKAAYILNNCRAAALLTYPAKLGSVDRLRSETPHLKSVWAAGLKDGHPDALPLDGALLDEALPAEPPPKECIDIDLAALIYTSGSTGPPKGVMMTHLNVVSAVTSITTYLEHSPADIILSVLPLSFSYGLDQVFLAFRAGATIVLEGSFNFPSAVIETLLREKATGFPIIPTIASILVQMDLSRHEFPHLRYLTSAAAALPVHHIAGLRAMFPRAKIFSMYGQTECKRASYLPPDQIDVRPQSVGRGMPNEEVYIVDASGDRAGPGVIGELVVRGANVMQGYWENPEETERVLKPGPLPGEKVLYSGDLFRMDEEGYLYFVGRKDDIIKTRGEKVSPKEIEEVLYSLEGVAEAAVVGVPDDRLGQAIKAVLTLRQGAALTRRDVLWHCSQKLEAFMMPKYVEFRDSLPKTESGKIAKRLLVSQGASA